MAHDPANAASDCPPQDVLRIIIAGLSCSDLPSVRLACHDMARAVDHHTLALRINRWQTRLSTAGAKRLYNVERIMLLTTPDWEHLQRLVNCLPQLHTLCILDKVNSCMPGACAAALTTLTRLDLGSNSMQVPCIPLPRRGSVQLHNLKAASFSSRHTKASAKGNGTLEDIAVFAPRLEQLYCQYLELEASLISNINSKAVLPHCTHYGGSELHIVGASSKGAGGAAFTKAFPNLQVFTCLPATIKVAAELKHHGKWNISSAELLSMCRKVRAGGAFVCLTAGCWTG